MSLLKDEINFLRERFLRDSPALASNHPYLQTLRGEPHAPDYATASTSDTSLRNDDRQGDRQRNDTSAVAKVLQECIESLTVPTKSDLQSGYIDPPSDNPDTRVLLNFCNECRELIDLTQPYFFCSFCGEPGYGFDLCESCARSGKRCSKADHELRLVKSTTVCWGAPVRILAKSLHSIPLDPKRELQPFVDSLNLQDANLLTVFEVYVSKATPKTNRIPVTAKSFRDMHYVDGETELPSVVPWITSAVCRWRLLCLYLAFDDYEPSIREFLTEEHMNVIKLLSEWWLGDIQDFRLTEMALNSFMVRSILEATSPEDLDTLAGDARSSYHNALAKLFHYEFAPDMSPYASELRVIRSDAARNAAAQRLGFLYLRQSIVPLWQNSTAPVDLTVGNRLRSIASFVLPAMSLCEAEDRKETYRFCVERLKASYTVMILALRNLSLARQLLGPPNLNASIAPCAWIPRAKQLADLPSYLWDKHCRKTVRTDNLEYFPEYVVVSHTWGRWRVKNSEVQLPAVPWKIPRNTRFAVDDLGDILNQVPGNTRYVWFDLVCIPQCLGNLDGTSPLRAIEKEEIGKQAAIFSRAALAVVWFNNIDDFGPLEDMCHILAMNILKYPGPFEESQLCNRLTELIKTTTSMMAERLHLPLGKAGIKPSLDVPWDEALDEWFTSLWALQEACIRPDMWLCTKSWKPLKSQPSGTPIPLDCLLSLVRANITILATYYSQVPTDPVVAIPEALVRLNFSDVEKHGESALIKHPPPCLLDFVRIATAAGLGDLPGIQRIRIITLGNQRYCRHRRAEAIMAVLGATEWFDRITTPSSRESNLVLGRYPLAFIEEVRRQLGDYQFFSLNIPRDFWAHLSSAPSKLTFEEKISYLKVKGTLLPFSDDASRHILRREGFENIIVYKSSRTHPAVADWRLETDGSVTVPAAHILMSSLQDPKPNIGTFHVRDHHKITGMSQPSILLQTEEMGSWMSQVPYKCYAVALERTEVEDRGQKACRFDGLLFRELKPATVIKTGTFVTSWLDMNDYGWSKAESVNWTVL